MTYYAYIGFKHTRMPMHTIDRLPSDWLELKQVLTEVMERVWREYQQAEAYVSLEHHLRGKGFQGFTGYRSRSFHFRQQVEAFFKVRYNPKLREAEFGQASFGPHLVTVSMEYWMIERGRRYRVAPLISREHQHLGDVKTLLQEPSGMRYADYSQEEHPLYDRGARRFPIVPHYRPAVDRSYAVQLLRQVGSGEGEKDESPRSRRH